MWNQELQQEKKKVILFLSNFIWSTKNILCFVLKIFEVNNSKEGIYIKNENLQKNKIKK